MASVSHKVATYKTSLGELTWQPFGPLDHFDELPLPQLIQAGQQSRGRVGLSVVMSGVHHLGLDGLQDAQEHVLGVEGQAQFGRWSQANVT